MPFAGKHVLHGRLAEWPELRSRDPRVHTQKLLSHGKGFHRLQGLLFQRQIRYIIYGSALGRADSTKMQHYVHFSASAGQVKGKTSSTNLSRNRGSSWAS